jgi:hypothetical protein
MKSVADSITSRVQRRSLPELLVHKFLTEYGYDHGPVIARAIVDDILHIVDQCYPEHLAPQTVLWLAVRRDWKGRKQKRIAIGDLTPVRLLMYTDEEVQFLGDQKLRETQQAQRTFNRARFARWCLEAYEQGGVLTQLDLSLISGLALKVVRKILHEYEEQTDSVLPTRGTVHDMGPTVTHKAEVIRRWLRHESPAEIARAVNHTQGAVDRYLADFQKIRLLAQRFPVADLPALSGLTRHVVQQYLDLIHQYEPELVLYTEAMESEPSEPTAVTQSTLNAQ